jgi:ketosteroid isomerase-like protein
MTSKEVVAEFYRLALAGEIEAMKALIDPNVRLVEAKSLPYGGVHVGLDAFMKVLYGFYEYWKDGKVVVKNLIADGEWCVAMTELTAVSAKSGIAFTTQLAEVHRVRDGRIIESLPFYFDTKELAEIHEGRRL